MFEQQKTILHELAYSYYFNYVLECVDVAVATIAPSAYEWSMNYEQ